ncbi:MAG: hypothetical protein ACP5J4_04260 [Anaerolineae bacterium]
MSTVLVKLRLSSQQYEQLENEAQAHKVSIPDIALIAVEDWLKRQARLDQARNLMRELGHGIGESSAPHNVAREHDAYLYTREDE